jgi:hypothetical protein
MTEAAVMARLGLRPWAEVVAAAREGSKSRGDRNPQDALRQSGRTWKMLVQAVVASSEGKQVVIEGHCPEYERELRDQARSWCRSCGIDPKLIVQPTRKQLRGKQDRYTFFTDHYVFESLWQDMMTKIDDKVW